MNRHSVPNAIAGYPGQPKNGGSNPRFYDFDDGVARLVKWNAEGPDAKASYNELVASRLGQLIGAPILRGIIVYVPDEIIPSDHRQTGARPGFHFAVTRMVGENFIPPQHYAEIDNRSELPFAAVHLAWLDVGDQHTHNQFLQQMECQQTDGSVKLTKVFRLIDMGEMFGSTHWTIRTLSELPDGYLLPSHLCDHLNLEKLGPALQALREIGDNQIVECFDVFPVEWNISEQDRLAAIDRVLKIRASVADRIRKANTSLK